MPGGSNFSVVRPRADFSGVAITTLSTIPSRAGMAQLFSCGCTDRPGILPCRLSHRERLGPCAGRICSDFRRVGDCSDTNSRGRGRRYCPSQARPARRCSGSTGLGSAITAASPDHVLRLRGATRDRRRRALPGTHGRGHHPGHNCIFVVVSVLVIADRTRGTGHFNLAAGALATVGGIGAALSNGVGGMVARRLGFAASFLCLAAIAVLAFLVFVFAVPETLRDRGDMSDDDSASVSAQVA